MANNPNEPAQSSVIQTGLQIWEFELNNKIGRILRELEVFEDESRLYIYYQNNEVGEISCTWRKFKSVNEYYEALHFEKLGADSFKRFFYDYFYSGGHSETWQALGKWEPGIPRDEVEGLNFVNPKRFFNVIFGDKDNFDSWLLQNFANFCLLGLNKHYEKSLEFRMVSGPQKGEIKTIRVPAETWNLTLLGQSQTLKLHGKQGLFLPGEDYKSLIDDETRRNFEFGICRFNYQDNYDAHLYVFKNGRLGTLDEIDQKLWHSGPLIDVGGFYSPAVPADKD